jgi:hypothetical protein
MDKYILFCIVYFTISRPTGLVTADGRSLHLEFILYFNLGLARNSGIILL